jgi:DNA-binding transcriptional MerR regulator
MYLNRFVERKLYGIEPSIRSGKGRGSRRWFSLEDLMGIALVWWLFESGLRTEVIKRILRVLGKSQKAYSKRAASSLRQSGAEVLIITREPRLADSKEQRTPQVIVTGDSSRINQVLKEFDGKSLQLLPVANLFASVTSRITSVNDRSEV